MSIELIPATADDADALANIQHRAFKRLYDIYHDEGSPYLRDGSEILEWLRRENWHVYKILADGVLCGGISVRERPEGEFYLARLYVLPEMQGRSIAPTAIRLCEKEFPRAKRWFLDFPINETPNRRCYEKAGYVDTGAREVQSGGAMTLAIYEKIM